MDQDDLVIHKRDREQGSARHPIVVVLDMLRSAYNVGNIFRVGEVCGIEKIVTCGYTATPPHPKVEKTALGTDKLVPCEHSESSLEAVQALAAAGYQTVAVETVDGAVDIWDVPFQFPVALVFGNEALGIEEDTLRQCDILAKLPVYGRKNSLNVGNCAAVALYAAVRAFYAKPRT